MSKIFILLSMFALHIIDDYFIQGMCLSNLKQKSWWNKNAPDENYKNDYIMALICHSFSWTFMIMLPLAIAVNFDLSTENTVEDFDITVELSEVE